MAVVERTQSTSKLLDLPSRLLSAVTDYLAATTFANSRAEKLAHYNQLSDAALEKRGLKREDIAHQVFPEMYFV